MDGVMVVTGLVGALVASSCKARVLGFYFRPQLCLEEVMLTPRSGQWGYFVFATVALFFIAFNVIIVGRTHADHIDKATVGKTYRMCGAWTMFLWFIYPIAWGLCEGGNVISPDSKAVFYGVLDILAKPVFGAFLLIGHRNIDPRMLGLRIRE
jgi:bacteriorhodopsin